MTKEERSLEIINQGLALCNNSAVAWSGGKDSMVLLHLMLKTGRKFPIIFFREPWQPWKYKFQDRIIQEYGLEAYTWHPQSSSFQQTDEEFEVQNVYSFDKTIVTCPSGITKPVDGKPWVCSLDMLKRPKQMNLQSGWDMVWVGHKGCDSDPIYGGDAGTRTEVRIVPGQATMMFPLRDWTHKDIWDYTIANNIPIDLDRYEEVNGNWGEKVDKLTNVDYVHACTACIDRRPNAKKFVHCPKYNGIVENCSQMLPWFNQTIPSYMKD